MWRCFPWLYQPDLHISTHTSRVGCDCITRATHRNWRISTHTSRVGCDNKAKILFLFKSWFLLTHPVWDVTNVTFSCYLYSQFLLTHPVWDVTIVKWQKLVTWEISTHTSRVGCDHILICPLFFFFHFYSHIPCGMWPIMKLCSEISKNFYSHIPCGMWRGKSVNSHPRKRISTHTSRVGCDAYGDEVTTWNQDFYSHIPCGMWPRKPTRWGLM